MKKLYVTGWLFLVIMAQVHAQEKSDSAAVNSEPVDSAELEKRFEKEFELLFDSINLSKGYFSISVGLGNRIFSLRNNSFNSQQGATNKLIITPSAAYYHKSGFGLSVTPFILADDSGEGLFQTAVTPSYDLLNSKDVGFGLAYTRYFGRDEFSPTVTPYKNDFYAYLNGKKGWLNPGISLGWANGQVKEAYQYDTTIIRLINGVLTPVEIVVKDTIATKIEDFSLVLSLQHSFDWLSILGKTDQLSLIPTLVLISGSQNFTINEKTSYGVRKRPRLRFFRSGISTDQNKFRVQSLALSMTLNYYAGNFSLSPQCFIDYYFPESSQRVNTVFNITTGFTF